METLIPTVGVYIKQLGELFCVTVLKVKRYPGHQDSRIRKVVSDILYSINWSQIEIYQIRYHI